MYDFVTHHNWTKTESFTSISDSEMTIAFDFPASNLWDTCFEVTKTSGISLINNEKSSGPKTDHWGTPLSVDRNSDIKPSINTAWLLPVRYYSIKRIVQGVFFFSCVWSELFHALHAKMKSPLLSSQTIASSNKLNVKFTSLV